MLALWFPSEQSYLWSVTYFEISHRCTGAKSCCQAAHKLTHTHAHLHTLSRTHVHAHKHTYTHTRTHTHTHTYTIHTHHTHTIHTPYTHHTHTIHTTYTQHTHTTQHTYTQHTYTHTHTHHAHALRHVKYSSTPGIKCGDNRREFCLVPSWCKCTTNMLCTPHNTQDKQWCGWTVGNSAPRCVPFPVLPIWNCILTFSLRSFLPSCYLLLIQIETISLHYDRYISVVT